MTSDDTHRVLHHACRRIGLDPSPAQLIRRAENSIYRLPGQVVARVGRSGQTAAAGNEVRVARWLERSGLAAVRVLPGVEQPVDVDGIPVTFWRALPPHQEAAHRQLAGVLRRLHALDPPGEFALPELAPFVRVRDRIEAAPTVSAADRRWLLGYLADLEARHAELPDGLAARAVHGDAWTGNVVSDDDGTVWLLDLERFAFGPPEWDLVSTAVRLTSFGTLDAAGYADFCAAYGYDVTGWAGYETLRDIRELRACSYMLQHAGRSDAARAEAELRVACLRGVSGDRPWRWRRVF
ncbi:phosphotransferase enzyme family protein [Jiangella alkaliphila]|uniref:Phosphotransferase enzyme family protein n=1 Tax=Jiangella alkaliphila TaxID=419479 RepID=A0A1H2M478_9ACTN|nr:aminoglycoside phosphotransferase family protein [Jiangella alkaliphila]SDU87959.1 Phosphotransferase enzyme family protein [Jiangella alkaliphila]